MLGRTKEEEKVEDEDQTNKKEKHQWAPRLSMLTFEKASANKVRTQRNDWYKSKEKWEMHDPL